MAKRKKTRLSSGEMEIMAMLWQEGPLALADAHQAFSRYGRPVSYPTMQTRLNRLAAKRLVTRTDDRPALYAAAVRQEDVAVDHLDQWLRTTRQTSIAPLVAHLIAERPLHQDEISELKKLLSEAESSLRHTKHEGA